MWELHVSVSPKNTTQCPQPGLEPGPLDPETSTLTMRPPRLPLLVESTNQLEDEIEKPSWNEKCITQDREETLMALPNRKRKQQKHERKPKAIWLTNEGQERNNAHKSRWPNEAIGSESFQRDAQSSNTSDSSAADKIPLDMLSTSRILPDNINMKYSLWKILETN